MKKWRSLGKTPAFDQVWRTIPPRIVPEVKVELLAILNDKSRWKAVPHQRFTSSAAPGKQLSEYRASGKTAHAFIEVTFLNALSDTVEWVSLTFSTV